jgi:hypothetical protein
MVYIVKDIVTNTDVYIGEDKYEAMATKDTHKSELQLKIICNNVVFYTYRVLFGTDRGWIKTYDAIEEKTKQLDDAQAAAKKAEADLIFLRMYDSGGLE